MANVPIRAVVLTASDTRREEDDVSGVTLVGLLLANEIEVIEKIIVSDDLEDIRNTLYVLTEREDVNLVLTTGGTGFSPRDSMPEATRSVIDREAPGINEAIRRESAASTPMAMLSRGTAGMRNQTLIINFPGSPNAVRECFDVIRPILQHALNIMCGEEPH